MPKFLVRIASAALTVCLLFDPVTAHALAQELQQPTAISPYPIVDLQLQARLQQEAFASRDLLVHSWAIRQSSRLFSSAAQLESPAMSDRLGASLRVPQPADPIIGQAIPPAVLQSAEARLTNFSGSLRRRYDSIPHRYFAEVLPQGAVTIHQEDEHELLLLAKIYEQWPPELSSIARDLMLFMHLVAETAELTIADSEPTKKPDMNREMAATIVQISAYATLAKKERGILLKAAETLDRQSKSQRYAPVLKIMDQLAGSSPTNLVSNAKLRKFIDRYDGYSASDYDEAKVRSYVDTVLRPKASTRSSRPLATQRKPAAAASGPVPEAAVRALEKYYSQKRTTTSTENELRYVIQVLKSGSAVARVKALKRVQSTWLRGGRPDSELKRQRRAFVDSLRLHLYRAAHINGLNSDIGESIRLGLDVMAILIKDKELRDELLERKWIQLCVAEIDLFLEDNDVATVNRLLRALEMLMRDRGFRHQFAEYDYGVEMTCIKCLQFGIYGDAAPKTWSYPLAPAGLRILNYLSGDIEYKARFEKRIPEFVHRLEYDVNHNEPVAFNKPQVDYMRKPLQWKTGDPIREKVGSKLLEMYPRILARAKGDRLVDILKDYKTFYERPEPSWDKPLTKAVPKLLAVRQRNIGNPKVTAIVDSLFPPTLVSTKQTSIHDRLGAPLIPADGMDPIIGDRIPDIDLQLPEERLLKFSPELAAVSQSIKNKYFAEDLPQGAAHIGLHAGDLFMLFDSLYSDAKWPKDIKPPARALLMFLHEVHENTEWLMGEKEGDHTPSTHREVAALVAQALAYHSLSDPEKVSVRKASQILDQHHEEPRYQRVLDQFDLIIPELVLTVDSLDRLAEFVAQYAGFDLAENCVENALASLALLGVAILPSTGIRALETKVKQLKEVLRGLQEDRNTAVTLLTGVMVYLHGQIGIILEPKGEKFEFLAPVNGRPQDAAISEIPLETLKDAQVVIPDLADPNLFARLVDVPWEGLDYSATVVGRAKDRFVVAIHKPIHGNLDYFKGHGLTVSVISNIFGNHPNDQFLANVWNLSDQIERTDNLIKQLELKKQTDIESVTTAAAKAWHEAYRRLPWPDSHGTKIINNNRSSLEISAEGRLTAMADGSSRRLFEENWPEGSSVIQGERAISRVSKLNEPALRTFFWNAVTKVFTSVISNEAMKKIIHLDGHPPLTHSVGSFYFRAISESDYAKELKAIELPDMRPSPQAEDRSHRIARIIKDQESESVLRKHLELAGIASKAEQTQLSAQGPYWVDKKSGQIHEQPLKVRQAMTAALSELLGRPISLDQMREAVMVEETMHLNLKEKDVARIRDDLLKALGKKLYDEMLDGFQRMYGPYSSELEAVEEIIAQGHFERYLRNPLRLLNSSGIVTPLDPRAAWIIRSAGVESILKPLSAYYDAKNRWIDALNHRDAKAYEKAVADMEKTAKEFRKGPPAVELLNAGAASLREAGAYPEGLIGDGAEILIAAGAALTDQEHQVIQDVATQMANARFKGRDSKEVAEELIASTRAMKLDDWIPRTLNPEMSAEQWSNRIMQLTIPDTARFWGMTRSSFDAGTPTEILMRPLGDDIAFRIAYIHEIIHAMAQRGYLPIIMDHELITHASTGLELYRAYGMDGLLRFGGPLYVALFERGQKIFDEGGTLDDLQKVLDETKKAEEPFLSAADRAERETKRRIKAILDPAALWEEICEYERLEGTLISGFTQRREEKTGQEGMAYILNYAVNILGRSDLPIAAMRANPENRRRAARLRRLMEDLARIWTRDDELQFVDWDRQWSDQAVPEVRYLPDFHKIVVPESVYYLDESVAKGLIAQEIFRAIHSRPDLIEESLKENSTFKELWYITDTPRVIEMGDKDLPGLREWINAYYTYRHTIPNLITAREELGKLPLPFQYMAAVLWLWDHPNNKDLDPRVTNPDVIRALKETRTHLEKAFKADAKTHYQILRENIWPVVEKLRDKAVQEEMRKQALEEMGQQPGKESSAPGGTLSPDQQKKADKHLAQQGNQENQQARQNAENTVDQAAQPFREQFGGQALADLVTAMMLEQAGSSADQQGQPLGSDELFPSGSPGSGSGTPLPSTGQGSKHQGHVPSDLNAAMEALTRESEALEQLAAQAERTAQQLKESTGELKDKNAAAQLAAALDDLAKQLHQEATRLHRKAGEFREQAEKTQSDIERDGRGKGQEEARALTQEAGDLTDKTQHLQDSAGEFEKQTGRLQERTQTEPESIQPALTDAFHSNAQKLKEQTEEIHDKAQQIENLAKAVNDALASPSDPTPPQPSGNRARAKTKDQATSAQSQPSAPPDPNTPSAPGGLTPPPAPRERIRPEPFENEFPGLPELSPEEQAAVTRQLEKLTSSDKPKKEKPEVEPEEVQNYRAEKRSLGAVITATEKALLAAFQQTEVGDKLTGLTEGDYIDPEKLAGLLMSPSEVMAIDILPGEFLYWMSLLTDISGSMLQNVNGERVPLEDSKLYQAARGAIVFRESTARIPGVESEEFAFSDNPAIELRTYRNPLNDVTAAAIHAKLFNSSHGGTSDAAAIKRAIDRMKRDHPAHPGLVVYGLGIGKGTATDLVKTLYAPNGYQLSSAAQIPFVILRILKRELSGKANKVHNILIVLTDGNPDGNEENTRTIKDMIKKNREQWAAAMSLRNALLSALVWGGLSFHLNHPVLGIVAVFIHALQFFLILRAGWKTKANPFAQWLMGGGIVADHVSGVYQPFIGSLGWAAEWFGRHEEVEAAVADAFRLNRIPIIGPALNHLVASLSDPLSLVLTAGYRLLETLRFRILRMNGDYSGGLYVWLTRTQDVWRRLERWTPLAFSLLCITAASAMISSIGRADAGWMLAAGALAPVTLPKEPDLPFRYETRTVNGGQSQFLVLNGQSLEVGRGGELTPQIEILPIKALGLPAVKKGVESFPCKYVARMTLNEETGSRRIQVPLSPYNLEKLSEMMAILASAPREKPNLYIRGPAATGKNTLIYLLAGLTHHPAHLMSLNYDTTERQLLALQTAGETKVGDTGYRLSPIVQAADNPDGAWGIADEVNKPAHPGVLAGWYSLAEHRFVTLPGENRVVVAPASFRLIAMGNPDRPPYIVKEIPIDFERRFQFVDMDYLHAPKRSHETPEEEEARRKELEFLLRLQAPVLYAEDPAFFEKLVLLGQDTVEAFEQGTLPRPMTVRGLMRIVRRLNAFPTDVEFFKQVLASAYNFQRLDTVQDKKLENLVKARFKGVDWDATDTVELKSQTIPKKIGNIEEMYYQILNAKTGKVLVERAVPPAGSGVAPIGRIYEAQTVLRYKLELMKAIRLGEHVLIFGETGTGKTSIVLDTLTNDLHMRPYQTQLNANSSVSALWGNQSAKNGVTKWEKTPTLRGMEEGRPVVLDDIGKPRYQAAISILNNILQNGQIMTPYGLAQARPGFSIIATTTPEDARYATHELSGEVEDRFWLMNFDWMTDTEEQGELMRRHPAVAESVIKRLVKAVGKLREREKKGELTRSPAIQDMSSSLERWQREGRRLYDIFLSVFGVEPSGEFADVVKAEFSRDKVELMDEKYSDYTPAPKPADILKATGDEQLRLLANLLQSFNGPAGTDRFSVARQGNKLEVKNTGTPSKKQVNIPAKLGPLAWVAGLRRHEAFSDDEKKKLEEIYQALIAPPIPFEVGGPANENRRYVNSSLHEFYKSILSMGETSTPDLIPLKANLRTLRQRLAQPANALNPDQRDKVLQLLRWLSQHEFLVDDDLRKRFQDLIASVENPTEGNAPAKPTNSLIGLTPDENDDLYALAGEVVPADLVKAMRSQLAALDPKINGALPELSHVYFGTYLHSAAEVQIEEGSPLVMLHEYLRAEPPTPGLQKARELLGALLLAHEGMQFHLRKNKNEPVDLTEELALFAEVDRLIWSSLSLIDQGAILHLAKNWDLKEADRPPRMVPSLQRLMIYSRRPDVPDTWKSLAQALASYPSFRGQALDLQRFEELRKQLLELKENTTRVTPGRNDSSNRHEIFSKYSRFLIDPSMGFRFRPGSKDQLRGFVTDVLSPMSIDWTATDQGTVEFTNFQLVIPTHYVDPMEILPRIIDEFKPNRPGAHHISLEKMRLLEAQLAIWEYSASIRSIIERNLIEGKFLSQDTFNSLFEGSSQDDILDLLKVRFINNPRILEAGDIVLWANSDRTYHLLLVEGFDSVNVNFQNLNNKGAQKPISYMFLAQKINDSELWLFSAAGEISVAKQTLRGPNSGFGLAGVLTPVAAAMTAAWTFIHHWPTAGAHDASILAGFIAGLMGITATVILGHRVGSSPKLLKSA